MITVGIAEDRRDTPVDFHLFQIDRDLEDNSKDFKELRAYFDKKFEEQDTRIRNLTRAAVGVLLALMTTSITLLLNTFKP